MTLLQLKNKKGLMFLPGLEGLLMRHEVYASVPDLGSV